MNREILRLAIPNILSNITVPLLSTVDTALMGRLSAAHIGAVGLGSMIFNFVYWNFGFLRMGTTGTTAQAFGRRSDAEIGQVLGQALFLALALAAVVLLLQIPLGQASFWLLNAPKGQEGLVAEYFFIRVWAAPATLALYAMMGWFFGMQNAIFPLWLTLLINVVNMAASYYMVAVLGWEVRGVAWGTVMAQYAGLAFGLILFYWRYRQYAIFIFDRAILQVRRLKRFLQINGDIFLRTLCLTLAFGFFYSRSADYGEALLAANVILLQYLNWMSYGVDGFAFAAESLVGKYHGAADRRQTYRAIRHAFAWGMGLAAIYALVYGLAGLPLLRVFTNQPEVIADTVPYLFWMVLFPLLGTPCYIWDGVYIGLTASRAMRNTMLLALLVFFAAYYFLDPLFGNHGLWATLLIFLVARGLFQHIVFARKGLDLT